MWSAAQKRSANVGKNVMDKIYGIHAATAFLTNHPQSVKRCYLLKQPHAPRLNPIIELCEQHNIVFNWLPKSEFEKQLKDVVHQGVFLDTTPLPVFNENDLFSLLETTSNPCLLILDNIQDPHNLGACLRTACAAGVNAVIVPKDKAVGLTSTVRKVASGAAETLPFCQVTNLARTMRGLKDLGIWLVGLAGDAEQSIYECDLNGSVGIVMGAEHSGLRRLTREHCDFLVKIPMLGSMESLNVSVATGVTLFEVVRRRIG